MPKLLIAESLDEDVLNNFKKSSNLKIIYIPDISSADLEVEIADYDGLIVRPKEVSKAVIANGKNLKLIIRGGAGVNSIALEACKENGVIVENTPGLNSDATAEFTINLMVKLIANRQISEANEKTHKGNPGIPEDYMGAELKGKRIGIIGLGNIGQRVARICTAFDMKVTCYARHPKELPYEQTDNLYDLLSADNDIVTLHIPLTNDTDKIIDDNAFLRMKKDSTIINTARPQLIDPSALKTALGNGTIKSFGIDGDYDLVEPFVKIDLENQGIITHHIADCTQEAQANIATQALHQAEEFFKTGKEINRVA